MLQVSVNDLIIPTWPVTIKLYITLVLPKRRGAASSTLSPFSFSETSSTNASRPKKSSPLTGGPTRLEITLDSPTHTLIFTQQICCTTELLHKSIDLWGVLRKDQDPVPGAVFEALR
jgi:hypothetical protein